MSVLWFDLCYHAGPRMLASALDSDADRVAIVGPSGIGKTSLLRAVLGLDAAARGTVSVRGRRLDTLASEARSLGWVPQEALLFPHLDVRQNLAFAASHDVERVARLVAIEPLLGRRATRLSGGERQRVAIGRALMRRPALLVLDEPVSALDRAARGAVSAAIEGERAREGFAILLTSHDEMDVAALADEVYEMADDGTLTRRSSPG